MTLIRRLAHPLAIAALATSACSVRLVATEGDRVTFNQCMTNSDCGSGASCSGGACFASAGEINEVLLEIVPEATSSSVGGLSFLYTENGLSHGNRNLGVTTLKPAAFKVQVQTRGDDLPSGCSYPRTSPVSIQATVEFARASSNDGFSISGLSKTPTSVDTRDYPGGWNASVTLSPGSYDIYIQPKSSLDCVLAPRVLRGVDVPFNVSPSDPPALLDLPKPLTLQGTVERPHSDPDDSLAGWQVDLIEPLDGRVISTTSGWPEGSMVPSATNFSINYQPLSRAGSGSSSSSDASTNSPILRMRPPDKQPNKAPTVYWSLSAIDLDGNGSVSLDLSGLPSSKQLVTVTGLVRVASGEGVAATVQFLSTNLEGTKGLTATFNQSVTADASGAYTTTLYPGQYKVVAAPTSDQSGGPASTSTITTQTLTVGSAPSQSADPLTLAAKRLVEGQVSAGAPSNPGLGATVEALPVILPGLVGVWRSALAQTPIVPDAASVAVSSSDASFRLLLDPGTFDISVRPGEGSNFGWWVSRLQVAASASGQPFMLKPRLSYPIPVEGTLDDGTHPLANAVIRAYAKVPGSSAVTKVGDTRTDTAGHYLLLLPPSVVGP